MIIGHKNQRYQISKILRSQRINKSFIFSGPVGIGKAKIALEMAKYILIKGAIDKIKNDLIFEPIDVVATQQAKMIDDLVHPDLIVVNRFGEASLIEEYQQAIANVYKKPIMSEYRVLIIDNAEKMNMNIFNSMLKLFEEPPSKMAIILITATTEMIPATLISRCCNIKFFPLSNTELNAVIKDLNYELAPSPELLLQLCNGSIRDYKQLVDINAYELYIELLSILSKPRSFQNELFLKLYDNYKLHDNWEVLKKLFIRVLNVILDKYTTMSSQNLIAEETKLLEKYSYNSGIIEQINKIIRILMTAEYSQLDPKWVSLACFELLADNEIS